MDDGSPIPSNEVGISMGDPPATLGVPMGVPRRGMLAGGGVPAYCARRTRGLGEPEIGRVVGGVPERSASP